MGPLLWPTVLLTGVALLGSYGPLLLAGDHGLPRWLTPLATGTMLGFCAFGLLPELGHEGGLLALLLVFAVAAGKILFGHKHAHAHAHAHAHGHLTVAANKSVDVSAAEPRCTKSLDAKTPCATTQVTQAHYSAGLAGSLCVHAVFDGALLFLASSLPAPASLSLMVSLGVHKAFEALSLASLLLATGQSRLRTAAWLAIYTLSFPFGVGLVAGLNALTEPANALRLALIGTALAVGNLLGCLVCDFLLPAVSQLRQNKTELVWLAAGVAGAGVLLVQL